MEYSIIHIISDPSLVKFQEKINLYCEGKDIINKIYSVTTVSLGNNGNSGFMAIPSCFIEYKCTLEELNQWKFKRNLNLE